MKHFILGFISGIVLLGILTCTKEEPVMAQNSNANFTPCDSIYYEPVKWGNPLLTVPNTRSTGFRNGESHWQIKFFGGNLIPPTNYQQTALRERIMFAHNDTLNYGDTIWACIKKYRYGN